MITKRPNNIKCVVFQGDRSLSDALRQAADWINQNDPEIEWVEEIIVNDCNGTNTVKIYYVPLLYFQENSET